VRAEISQTSKGYPAVFEKAELTYSAQGSIDGDKFLEAVKLSQTKYCGVSAMLSKSFPIHYRVELNGTEIGRGEAYF
jgi:putative redox protein